MSCEAPRRAAAPETRSPGGTRLHAADVVTLAYASLLTLLTVAFAPRIPAWRLVVSLNVVAAAGIVALASLRARIGGRLLASLHDWYLPPLVFVAFKELGLLIQPLHRGRDYDAWLIAADRSIFGADPTRWLARVARPLPTEILQVAYTSFYLLFLIAGFDAWRRADGGAAYRRLLFVCVYGFYLSFLGYLVVPAVGPRFTLYDAAEFRSAPQGLWLTPALRWFVDAGDSISPSASLDAARSVAERDLFPSGHAMMSLVLMYWSARLRLKSRYVIFIVGSLIVVATVYLRYHYVVDVIGGMAFAALCLATAPRLYAWIAGRVGGPDRPLAAGAGSSGRHA